MNYLDNGEHVILKNIKSKPLFIAFVTEFLVISLCLFVLGLLIYTTIRLNNGTTLKTLTDTTPIFKYYNILMYVVILALIPFVIYQTISIIKNDIIITNKAIIKKKAFSFDKVCFHNITNIQIRKSYSALSHQEHKRNAFWFATLTGTNYQVEVYSVEKNVVFDGMTKKYAESLTEKIKTIMLKNQ